MLVLVGGLDPTGGAGLLRDWWTARSRGFDAGAAMGKEREVACVTTALTIQGAGRPARAFPVNPGRLGRLLSTTTRDRPPTAIKIGLVPRSCAEPVLDWLDGIEHRVPVVLDPVLAASDGGSMGASVGSLRALAERSSICTPNPDEARALFGGAEHEGDSTRSWSASLPGSVRRTAILLKSARVGAVTIVDRLVDGEAIREFEHQLLPDSNPRGTGCALATAIACELSRGTDRVAAVGRAIAWLGTARQTTRVGPDGRLHLAVAPAEVSAAGGG